ncbi:MAG: right-handed parallel beta-helix repeat-containing protein [Phycisphaerales bacterium]
MNPKRMKNTRLFSTLTGLLIAGAMTVGVSGQSADWFVDGATGDDDLNSGTLWSAPFETLQKALDEASAGLSPPYVIFVAAGTYHPDEGPTQTPDDRSAAYDMIEDVAVYGGFLNGDDFGDRDPIANETILSGELDDPGDNTDNSFHVVTFSTLTGNPALLDGFTVRDGFADGTIAIGGGVFVVNTDDALIRNCVFEENIASTGGGVGVQISTGDMVEVRNCLFEQNEAAEGGGIGSDSDLDTDVNVINCEFLANEGYNRGGGAYCIDARMTFINATFTLNFVALTGADKHGGGAFFTSGADAVFINSLFVSNTTNDDGGAVYLEHSVTTAVFDNCTFSNNHASGSGGGITADDSSSTTITNCILWGNTDGAGGTDTEHAQLYLAGGASATATYTCIEELDDYSATGNIADDPLFVDPDDNYRLLAVSPCIDAADNDAVDCDEFDVDEDGEDCDAPAQDTPDLDFADRRVDDPDTDDTGNGTPPIVDMGPYESVPCPWDLDGDCVVGAKDLMFLLKFWDDPYGAADMLDLIAAWGPCPCDPDAIVLSLADELDDACLTQADWDEYEDVMTDPESSQAEKDNYQCWMEHYLNDCNKCFCIGASGCPDDDPFN